jgi:hypothetical protein
MARWKSERGATFRWQQGQRKPVAASVEELVIALARLRAEAGPLAEEAYLAIQNHCYQAYAAFRAKLDEHAALVAILRSRKSRPWETGGSEARRIGALVDAEETEIVVLVAKASLKFCFALSANPLLPLGARETFVSEIDALRQVRRVLEHMPPDKLPANLLEEVDTARMILEEVIAKSPALVDLGRADAATPVAA